MTSFIELNAVSVLTSIQGNVSRLVNRGCLLNNTVYTLEETIEFVYLFLWKIF